MLAACGSCITTAKETGCGWQNASAVACPWHCQYCRLRRLALLRARTGNPGHQPAVNAHSNKNATLLPVSARYYRPGYRHPYKPPCHCSPPAPARLPWRKYQCLYARRNGPTDNTRTISGASRQRLRQRLESDGFQGSGSRPPKLSAIILTILFSQYSPVFVYIRSGIVPSCWSRHLPRQRIPVETADTRFDSANMARIKKPSQLAAMLIAILKISKTHCKNALELCKCPASCFAHNGDGAFFPDHLPADFIYNAPVNLYTVS